MDALPSFIESAWCTELLCLLQIPLEVLTSLLQPFSQSCGARVWQAAVLSCQGLGAMDRLDSIKCTFMRDFVILNANDTP